MWATAAEGPLSLIAHRTLEKMRFLLLAREAYAVRSSRRAPPCEARGNCCSPGHNVFG